MSDLSPDRFSLLYRQQLFLNLGFELVFYGIQATLVSLIFFFAWTIKTEKQTSYKVLLALILCLFVSQTIHVVCYWYFIWFAFIQNGSTSDQTIAVLTTSPALGSSLLGVFGVLDFMSTVSIGIADSILVWRCWVICKGNWKAVIVPLICTIGYIATSLTGFGIEESPIFYPESVTTPLNIASYTFSLATTVISTLTITFQILRVTRMSGNRTGVAGMAGAQGSLNKVVEILLESAALYTIASLIYIPIYASVVSLQTQSNSLVYYEYAQLFWANTAYLAPTLIMLRVSLGRTRPEWSGQSQSEISGLQFQSSPGPQARRTPRALEDGTTTILTVSPGRVHGEEIDTSEASPSSGSRDRFEEKYSSSGDRFG